ncbi:MAG: UDP-N-acetylmuramoyl-L-alanine--D-glutamate ligase [Oscillospiraceae bacterium]|nr:UDP-N-acetylmuramoyl-L-alanine--D-glutamate ligase [Oscillospiraceae bacterium]
MTEKIKSYFDNLKGKRVAFVGLGRSNLPLIKMFCDSGAVVFACDSRAEDTLGANAQLAKDYGATLSLGENYLSDLDVDMLFRTPGMKFFSPELDTLREKGTEITSEMELFFELCPCKIIAITGSDGKTTTTTIISELLKTQGYTVHLGGNIGNPLMPEIFEIKEDDVAVVELSSFQLISMKKSPNVAVVTNLAPNHLDWHKDMEEYIEAKRNIICFQNESDVAVLNHDNEITNGFSKDVKGNLRYFSSAEKVENGAYISEGSIRFADDNGDREVLKISDILIPGHHNIENYMAAISATYGLVDIDTIKSVARTFNGVRHRAQLVREFEGVRYYNDSIASSPTRTACGMLSLFEEKIILICGGYDKKIPYTPLGPVICKKVKTLILMGATADKIEEAVKASAEYAEGAPVILHADNMEEAVLLARENATSGDIISLSPASASFDKYRDFEERGNHFISIVNELK